MATVDPSAECDRNGKDGSKIWDSFSKKARSAVIVVACLSEPMPSTGMLKGVLVSAGCG